MQRRLQLSILLGEDNTVVEETRNVDLNGVGFGYGKWILLAESWHCQTKKRNNSIERAKKYFHGKSGSFN
jgi:hypothetical protein